MHHICHRSWTEMFSEVFRKKSQKTQISYEFTGNIDFPVITICETREDAYDENVFKQCQLNISDYKKNGPWSGSGNSFCKNPKDLYNKVSFKPKDLDIEWIKVGTFTKIYRFRSNNITEVLGGKFVVPFSLFPLALVLSHSNSVML